LEYKQQAGRAGRPRYDKHGEAIAIAKNEEQKEQIFDNYVLGDTEPIFSKLGSQTALRMHLLSAIATNFIDSEEGVYKFIDSTFYAHQSDTSALRDDIDATIEFLLENGFIECINDKYLSTLLGNRTSSLYIDPLSALQLKKALEKSCSKETSSLSFVHAVCSTPDVRSLYLRKGDFWVEEKAEQHAGDFLLEMPVLSSEEYEWFLSDLKTALLIEDWIDEIPEDGVVSKYNVGPGDIHNIVEMAGWLLHASREFARMYNFECVSDISDIMLRVQYGCKKELLNLVSLKGIGRIRARAIFNEGFKTIGDLRGVPIKRIAEIKTVGEGIAKSIKKQIGESDSFLKQVISFTQKLQVIIQVFDADMIFGKAHLISSVEHATRAMERKTNTTNSLDKEILLYASGERQIKLAIPKMGIKKGNGNIAFVFVSDVKTGDRELSDNLVGEVLESFSLVRDDSVLEGDMDTLRKFDINENEIKTVTKAKYGHLILEKVAMVDIIK